MSRSAPPIEDPLNSGHVSRRTLMKTGAAGGALVWAVPAMQIIGMASADAASGGTPPPSPPPTNTCIPSNGLLFFSVDGTTYGVKVSESGSVGRIPANAQFSPPSPSSWSDYPSTVSGGLIGTTGSYLVLPSGSTFVAAYVADGNATGASGAGDAGHDYTSVSPDGDGRLVYTKVC